MDRNGTALNTLMFIRMSSNIFYPFSTIYPGSGYRQRLKIARFSAVISFIRCTKSVLFGAKPKSRCIKAVVCNSMGICEGFNSPNLDRGVSATAWHKQQ